MMTGLPCTAVRPSAAPAEDEERAGQRVFVKLIPAKRGERIDAFAEVDRLASEQNLELRDELNHSLVRSVES